MNIPLGVILLAAVPLPKPQAHTRKLHDLARQAIQQADIAAKTLAGRSHVTAR